VKDYQKTTGKIPACLAFGLSSLIRFYAGIQANDAGEYAGMRDQKPYPVKDDAHVLSFFAALKPDMPEEKLAQDVLSNTALWGEDLTAIPGLADQVAAQLKEINAVGIRAAMKKTWEK
jgi:tagaturonate reductase